MRNPSILLTLLVWVFCAQADEFPLQPNSPYPHGPIELLPDGTTDIIAGDWARSQRLENQPDSSMRSVWVRLFPLLKLPLGDPYPKTNNISKLDLNNPGGVNIFKIATGQLLASGKVLHFDFTTDHFMADGKSIPLEPLWVSPAGGELTQLTWDQSGVRVRGGVVIRQTPYTESEIHWSAINVLDVEEYLLAVVPSEVISGWQHAVLEAQAIAARTYTLYHMTKSRKAGQGFDVDPTTYYQSYRGAQFLVDGAWEDIESTATSHAVTVTHAEAVTFNREVIEAFFSGNSGGIVCSAKECFNQAAEVPYLRQKKDAPGVIKVSGGTWGSKAKITPATIARQLATLGIHTSSHVVKLVPLKHGPSGRVWRLRVMLKSGRLDLDETQTRRMMKLFGPIRSFLYSLRGLSHGHQLVVGHGYGHGVGMSQEGARIFAEKGWNARKILSYYFPGTEIVVLH